MMKPLLALKIFPTLFAGALILTGCAHGSAQTPVDEAQAVANDEQKEITDNQASGRAQRAQDQAASLVGNAAMSKAIATEVMKRMPLIADAKTLTYVNSVGQYIAQSLVPTLKCTTDGTAAVDVRIAIVKSSIASAFSIPGGVVFITTALMQRMNSEDEFAGVLANEMVLSICEKGVPADLGSQAVTGWADYILSLPTKSVAQADLAFADKYALVTLYRRGYDITPYVMFIAKNEISGRHLYGAERAVVLQKSVAATPPITPTASARASRFKAAKSKSI